MLGIDSIGNLLGRVKVSIRTTDGIDFKCRIDSVSTISQISSWFREISETDDSPVKSVIDVGAHVGIFSLYASRHFRQAVIFAVEPSPENYELLLQNLSANRSKNITPLRAAISDNDGVASFWMSNSSLGGSTVNASNGEPLEVQCYRLDTLLPKFGPGAGLLLKIDVESAEVRALRGATETLNRSETVIIEVDKSNQESVITLLSRSGFQMRVIDEDSKRSYLFCSRIEPI